MKTRLLYLKYICNICYGYKNKLGKPYFNFSGKKVILEK